jgi:putative inorganic carbon (HCO3(-)) transporter
MIPINIVNNKQILALKNISIQQWHVLLAMVLLLFGIGASFYPVYTFVLVLGCLWLGFLYFHLEFGVILLIALSPFLVVFSETETIANFIGSDIPKTWLRAPKDIWLLSLLLIWGIHILQNRVQFPKRNIIMIPIFVFIGLSLIYMFTGPNFLVAFWDFRAMVEFMAIFFVIASVIDDIDKIKRVIKYFIGSGLIFALWGFSHILKTKIGMGVWFGVLPEHVVGRLTLFGDEFSANAYAIFMSILVSFCLGMIVYIRKLDRFWRWLLTITMLFTGMNLIFTFSRRSWLGVLSAMVFIGFLSGKAKVLIRVFAIILIGLLVAILVQPLALSALWSRISTFDPSNITIKERLDEWMTLLSRIYESNLLGLGLGTVGPVSVDKNVLNATLTHNSYLMIFTEMGIFGLLIFLWLLATIIYVGIKLFRIMSENELRAVVLGLLAGIITLIISAMGGVTFVIFPSTLYFWLFVGLLGCLHTIKIKQNNKSEKL